jgi:TatA/E family protein of Tat protein translocase
VGIGGWEVMVIFFVVLLVFGPKRIPEVARGLGKGMRELRRISTDFQREINLAEVDLDEPERPAPALPETSTPREAPASVPRSPAQAPEGGE